MENKREPGYYWVKYKEGGKWVIVEWSGQWFHFPGISIDFPQETFFEIIESPIQPPN